MPQELLVVNKVDDAEPLALAHGRAARRGGVFVSAQTGEGVDPLQRRIAEERARAGAAGGGSTGGSAYAIVRGLA